MGFQTSEHWYQQLFMYFKTKSCIGCGEPCEQATPPIKDYLCYKMITSQNVPFEAQVKNFFVL